MEADVERAHQVVELLKRRLAAENLIADFELLPREFFCEVYVDFPSGDGLLLDVTHRSDTVRILDPGDEHLTPAELADYIVMRARGSSPEEALAVLVARSRTARPRWWRRLLRWPGARQE
ncbi:hypothetical protein [Thermomonospora amylolytica]|uniref:hypothetical protein n=1 Tax=Thermomonospora amylolytica TaxID=1411117 RepID=UPI000E6C10A0|nr:hypothetical protein [Thermomonospora amylolytica]